MWQQSMCQSGTPGAHPRIALSVADSPAIWSLPQQMPADPQLLQRGRGDFKCQTAESFGPGNKRNQEQWARNTANPPDRRTIGGLADAAVPARDHGSKGRLIEHRQGDVHEVLARWKLMSEISTMLPE